MYFLDEFLFIFYFLVNQVFNYLILFLLDSVNQSILVWMLHKLAFSFVCRLNFDMKLFWSFLWSLKLINFKLSSKNSFLIFTSNHIYFSNDCRCDHISQIIYIKYQNFIAQLFFRNLEEILFLSNNFLIINSIFYSILKDLLIPLNFQSLLLIFILQMIELLVLILNQKHKDKDSSTNYLFN